MGEKTDSESFSKFVKQYNLQSLLVPFSYGLNMVVEEHGKKLRLYYYLRLFPIEI